MRIFVLRNTSASDGDAVTTYLPLEGSRRGDAPPCEVCGRFFRLMPLVPPVRVELKAWGTTWGDIAFGPGDQLLVSDSFKSPFVAAGLVGISSFDPVEVVRAMPRRVAQRKMPSYWLASIVRGRAAIDDLASGLVRDGLSACRECRLGGVIKRTARIVLEADTWSGEDVFFARGLPGTVLVSERFGLLCEANGLTNCSLVSLERFHFDYYPQR